MGLEFALKPEGEGFSLKKMGLEFSLKPRGRSSQWGGPLAVLNWWPGEATVPWLPGVTQRSTPEKGRDATQEKAGSSTCGSSRNLVMQFISRKPTDKEDFKVRFFEQGLYALTEDQSQYWKVVPKETYLIFITITNNITIF